MEQEEYTKEQINWSYIEFVDNQDVLDLIEKVCNSSFPPPTHTLLFIILQILRTCLSDINIYANLCFEMDNWFLIKHPFLLFAKYEI